MAEKFYEDCSGILGDKRFAFDGTFLGILMRKGLTENVTKCIRTVLDEQQRENGFTGTKHKTKSDDNRQYSDLFGYWMKVGALTLVNDKRIRNSVLNDRGHILYSSALIQIKKRSILETCNVNSSLYDLFCEKI